MSSEPALITVDPSTELGRALTEANGNSVQLIVNGVRYRVSREAEDLWDDYDPEQVLEALNEFAGTITPEEGERRKELIYRGREEGTRPIDRP
jgi:hypothetical protein